MGKHLEGETTQDNKNDNESAGSGEPCEKSSANDQNDPQTKDAKEVSAPTSFYGIHLPDEVRLSAGKDIYATLTPQKFITWSSTVMESNSFHVNITVVIENFSKHLPVYYTVHVCCR